MGTRWKRTRPCSSPTWMKATLYSPSRRSAFLGIASARFWSTEIWTVAYISGRRSLSGLSKVQRTLAVRVAGSSMPLTQSTWPLNTLSL